MVFSYVDPVGRWRDGLRLLVGDTSAAQPLLQDEEYEFLRAQWPYEDNLYMLASYAAETIAGKFAREIDFSADSQTVSAGVLQDKFTALAAQLRARAKTVFAGDVYIGGLDPWQPQFGVEAPSFGTQMHDNPEAGRQDFGDAGGHSYAEGYGYEQ